MKASELNMLIEASIRDEVRKAILSENEHIVYHITCGGEPLATYYSVEEAKEDLPKYQKSNPGKELIIEKGSYKSHADMIEKFDEMTEELNEQQISADDLNKNVRNDVATYIKAGYQSIQPDNELYQKYKDVITNTVKSDTTMRPRQIDAHVNNTTKFLTWAKNNNKLVDANYAKFASGHLKRMNNYNINENMKKVNQMEGNEFSQALLQAKKAGKDKFTVGGKEYDVKECWSKMEESWVKEQATAPKTKPEPTKKSFSDKLKNIFKNDPSKPSHTHSDAMKDLHLKMVGLSEEKCCSNCGAAGELDEKGMCYECSGLMMETNFIKIVKKVVNEAMKGQTDEPGVPGVTITKRAQKGSKKENSDYIKDTEKKMKDYLSFNGNDNPEFPNPIGKGDKMAINNTDKQDAEKDRNFAGMQNLDYDLEPSQRFKDRLKMAIEGDSTMGNKNDGANVVNSKKAAKQIKAQIKNSAEDKKNRTLYPKEVVPIKLKEDIDKINRISGYNKKTQ